MNEKNQIKKNKRISGLIISDKMRKTRVVEIQSFKKHPKYQKYYRTRKRFKVHDEKEEYHTGDKVVIEETRPISRWKRWKIIAKL
ncbi:MAG: 30S ribosomal protein S17 [Patescibacteria group bacterium]